MAGRRGTPPRSVAFAQVPAVDDPKTQRALDVLAAAVQELQARAPSSSDTTDVFTSTEDGLAPASGGGTSNFLRADGTWAAPSGGAVSSVSAGSSKVSVSPTTGAVVVDVVEANFTGIPQAGVVNLVSDLAAKAPTARTLNATAPVRIDGGASGDLSANRTISVTQNSTSTDGVVPQAPNDTSQFWRGDASWASPVVPLSSWLYGEGIDGSATMDGVSTVASMVPSSSVYTATRDLFFQDLSVSGGVTLRMAGYRLFVSGTLTVSGTIHNGGSNASGSTGGTAAGEGSLGGGSAGAAGANGGNVNAGGAGVAINPTLPAPWTSSSTSALGGSGAGGSGLPGNVRFRGGGGGASGAGNVGGNGGGITVSAASEGGPAPLNLYTGRGPRNVSATAWRGGSGGGGGGGTGVGGGGGGGGGPLVVAARALTGAGTIHCNGGNGANGVSGNSGGGGGGGGGWVSVYYATRSGSVSITANGGTAGARIGTGGDGGAGADGYTFTYNTSGDGS